MRQLTEASDSLRLALEKVQAAYPNARDYYPQGALAFGHARAEWGARCNTLLVMRQELEQIIVFMDEVVSA